MATVAQVNTWLGLLPSDMQIALSKKLGTLPLLLPTAAGNEKGAYVIRNFIAQEYGLASAEAILANPWGWEGGRFISEFQIKVLYPYAVPAVYKSYTDGQGIALEEHLVREGILRSDQTLADTSQITPNSLNQIYGADFFAVESTGAVNNPTESEDADSTNSELEKEFKIEEKEVPDPGFGQFLQCDTSSQLIVGYNWSTFNLPGVHDSAENAMLNQQSSLLVQSLATINNLGASDLMDAIQRDDGQSHILVTAHVQI